ncbi:tetratricopeptide repeat protein [Candidatus Amoebophilus asiaticus]|nr:tetratricopeptide repeat protein [Candidatus Amoebophilus asiaticus]
MKLTCIITIFSLLVPTSGKSQLTSNYSLDSLIAAQYLQKADSLATIAQYESANDHYQKAGKLYKVLNAWKEYYKCLNDISWNYMSIAHYEKAISISNTIITESEEKLGIINFSAGSAYNLLGLIYMDKGSYDLALNFFNKALIIARKLYKKASPAIAITYHNIGIVYYQKNDYFRALEYYRKALNMKRSVMDPYHTDIADSYVTIANVYKYLEKLNESLSLHKKALSIYSKKFGTNHPSIATCYTNIGGIHYRMRDFDKAREYCTKAIEIKCNYMGNNHPDIGELYVNLGNIYNAEHLYVEAYSSFKKSIRFFVETFGNFHPLLGKVYNEIAVNYVDMFHGHNNETKLDSALDCYQKAIMSLVQGFESNDIYTNPLIRSKYASIDYGPGTIALINSKIEFLDVLAGKAEAFELLWEYKHSKR